MSAPRTAAVISDTVAKPTGQKDVIFIIFFSSFLFSSLFIQVDELGGCAGGPRRNGCSLKFHLSAVGAHKSHLSTIVYKRMNHGNQMFAVSPALFLEFLE
ncbi:hypothetical protein MHYP_G00239460 [Metynnis hypsauchen]